MISELDRRFSRICELQRQNDALATELDTLRRSRDGKDRKESSGGVGTDQNNRLQAFQTDFAALNERYTSLLSKYSELEEIHGGCKASIDRALRKYDASKRVIKQWKDYIDRQPSARKVAPNAGNALSRDGSFAPGDQEDRETTPRASRQPLSWKLPFDRTPNHDGNESSDVPSRPFPNTVGAQAISSPARSSSQSKRITSSQSTDDPHSVADGLDDANEEIDDEDGVEVIREVNLKRKRSNSAAIMPPPHRIKQEPVSQERPGSAERPLELRSDDFSSPVARRRIALRTESSDLDAMTAGRTLAAPKPDQEVATRAKSEEASESNSSNVPPFVRQHSSLSDSDIAEVERHADLVHALPEAREAAREPSRRLAHGKSHRQAAERKGEALAQISPNLQSSPRKRRVIGREGDDDADKVAFVSEDGDERTSQVQSKAGSTYSNTVKAVASHRLGTLLEKPTPAKQALSVKHLPEPTSLPRPTGATKHRRQQRGRPKVTTPVTPASRGDPRTIKSEQLKQSRDSPTPVLPEDESLRIRPLQMLRLEDFRPNPKYAGSDFAFADSIRGREARRCLPGCTKPECCGHFLEMARAGMLPPTSKSDNHLLEDYLGPTFRDILAGFPAAKCKDLLLRARAQDAANTSGKHRQAFERPKSPPGYWRTDMPSTQEQEEYRKKALEMERQKVEDRWREALRPDGQWLFRDE